MHKKFRCGRLTLTRDGRVKKLDLNKGGGTRLCEWQNQDMTLDDAHQLVRNIFKLDDNEPETSLFDFQLQPLVTDQYKTLLDYIHHNGLSCNGTIIYICNKQAKNNCTPKKNRSKKKKRKDEAKTSKSKEKAPTHRDMPVPATLIERDVVVKNEPNHHDQESYNLLLEYSFTNSSNNMMRIFCDLINENNFNKMLIQFYEHVSLIHSYACLRLDRLKQDVQYLNERIQTMKQADLDLNSAAVNSVNDICESMNKLFKLHQKKFRHIEQFPMFVDVFNDFYRKFKILNDRWHECIKNKVKSHTVLSSIQYLIDDGISPLGSCDIRCSSEHTSETKKETPNGENLFLFQPVLNYARELLESMDSSRLTGFRTFVKSLIDELEYIQATTNFHDSNSLTNAKQKLSSLRNQYGKTFTSHAFTSGVYQFTRPTRQAYQKTLTELCELVKRVKNYQATEIDKQNEDSNTPSIYLSKTDLEQEEDGQCKRSPKRKVDILQDQADALSYCLDEYKNLSHYITKQDE